METSNRSSGWHHAQWKQQAVTHSITGSLSGLQGGAGMGGSGWSTWSWCIWVEVWVWRHCVSSREGALDTLWNQTSWEENCGLHGVCPHKPSFTGFRVGDWEALPFLGGRLDSRKNLPPAAGLTWAWMLLPLPCCGISWPGVGGGVCQEGGRVCIPRAKLRILTCPVGSRIHLYCQNKHCLLEVNYFPHCLRLPASTAPLHCNFYREKVGRLWNIPHSCSSSPYRETQGDESPF